MRENLDWSERDHATRPTVRIVMDSREILAGRGVWLEDEVNEFLYRCVEIQWKESFHFVPSMGWGQSVIFSSQGIHDLTCRMRTFLSWASSGKVTFHSAPIAVDE